jgi:hypothetical protein
MDSTEIAKVCDECDKAWPDKTHPNMPTEVCTMIASWQTAYQLAILNEQIGDVLNSRIPRVRVMVEPGEWPIQVDEQRR